MSEVVRHIYESRSEGDLLMDSDSPATLPWVDLRKWAGGRSKWRVTVQSLRSGH